LLDTFKLKETDKFLDLDYQNNQFIMIEKTDSIAQSIKVLLYLIRGDDLLHPNLGLPKDAVFRQHEPDAIKFLIMDTLFQDPRVQELADFSATKETDGTIKVEGSIITKDADTIFFKELIQYS